MSTLTETGGRSTHCSPIETLDNALPIDFPLHSLKIDAEGAEHLWNLSSWLAGKPSFDLGRFTAFFYAGDCNYNCVPRGAGATDGPSTSATAGLALPSLPTRLLGLFPRS